VRRFIRYTASWFRLFFHHINNEGISNDSTGKMEIEDKAAVGVQYLNRYSVGDGIICSSVTVSSVTSC
jgi:hypothetical protein